MTFAQPVDRSGKKPGTEVYVASATVAMGWISVTRVCQHFHRNVLRTGFPGSAGLRNRPSPFTAKVRDERAWQFYFNNLELQEILPRNEADQLRGTISKDLTAVMVAYDHFGSPGADRDALRNVDTVTLGVQIPGDLGRL